MKKKLIFVFIFIVTVAILALTSPARAQSQVQKNLEGVKTKVENLVTAKDEKSPNELALRVETLKKVIDLSISEAKDLKIKLLALEISDENILTWRDGVISGLNQALQYYEEQKEKIEENAKIDLETVKKMANDFKAWRERNFLPQTEEANEFLLILQEDKAIETAAKRWERIEKDVVKLEKAKVKGVAELRGLLTKANQLIEEGKKLNAEAGKKFSLLYIATSTPTSTTENTTSTTSTVPIIVKVETSTTTEATSTTSTETALREAELQTSIKDLVESSLVRIKEAYQIFIEMSNLVRKLL